MDPTFAHPKWILAGVALILGGLWLFRWARRNDASEAIAAATADVAINKLRKNSPKPAGAPSPAARISTATRFRNSMAQLAGILGILMLISGLVAAVFGIFYPAA